MPAFRIDWIDWIDQIGTEVWRCEWIGESARVRSIVGRGSMEAKQSLNLDIKLARTGDLGQGGVRSWRTRPDQIERSEDDPRFWSSTRQSSPKRMKGRKEEKPILNPQKKGGPIVRGLEWTEMVPAKPVNGRQSLFRFQRRRKIDFPQRLYMEYITYSKGITFFDV